MLVKLQMISLYLFQPMSFFIVFSPLFLLWSGSERAVEWASGSQQMLTRHIIIQCLEAPRAIIILEKICTNKSILKL